MVINFRAISALFFFITLFMALPAIADDENNVDTKGYLLHGYDPVTYFDLAPAEGSDAFSFQHKGSTLLFQNAVNLNKFKSNPERYYPKYGAYCAYGVRMGKKLDIDPLAYAIVDDRLYVLLNRSTREIWQKERQKNIGIADRMWPLLRRSTGTKN